MNTFKVLKSTNLRNKEMRKDTGEAIGLHASDMVVRLPDADRACEE